MPKAMIITVGTGRNREDIANAISWSIKRENPEYVFFLTTPKSHEETLPLIRKLFPQDKEVRIDVFEETDNVQDIYLHYLEIIKKLMNNGYSKEDIVIDYTSGTKAMSAALFAAGIALEIESINYVAGKRDNAGRVIPGTEKIIAISPHGIFAENKIRTAQSLFNKYQFEAGLSVLNDIISNFKEPSVLERVDFLMDLGKAYSLWDKFHLEEANKQFGKLKDSKLLASSHIHDILLNNLMVVNQGKGETYSIFKLVDLVQNILRRIEEGKYDDAMARIYRAFEYTAQFKLYRDHNGIKTKRIEINKLTPMISNKQIADKYKKLVNKEGILQLSMVRAYELLSDLGDSLGKEFMEDYCKKESTLNILLNKRNNSILAHGFKPIDRESCESLLELLKAYISRYFPDYFKEESKAVFPRF